MLDFEILWFLFWSSISDANFLYSVLWSSILDVDFLYFVLWSSVSVLCCSISLSLTFSILLNISYKINSTLLDNLDKNQTCTLPAQKCQRSSTFCREHYFRLFAGELLFLILCDAPAVIRKHTPPLGGLIDF